jgi:hypothetical protein
VCVCVSMELSITLINTFQYGRGSSACTCIDYLLACTEYAYFLQLIEDVRQVDQWDCDEVGDAE